MKKYWINKLVEQARIDPNIWLIISDVGYNLVEPFEKEFPDRFINVGIAEQNALGIAAGLSEGRKNVYYFGIIPFITYRCMDQIRMFMNHQKLPIKLIGTGIGTSYKSFGYSHWGIEDEDVMKCFKHIKTITPITKDELDFDIEFSFKNDSPMYIRLGVL